ncbi:MAG TPA: hypothetical protein VGI81_16510 [Tepidisphaeraceae bacterium]|jgi:hypothetical protein
MAAAPKSQLQSPGPARNRRADLIAALSCLLLLATFAAVSWLSVRQKNATFDEPNDSIEAWIATRYADYRISPADPPLAYYWAALPQPKNALRADFNATNWTRAAHEVINEHRFSIDTLYHTPGNDADRFIARSRAMMLVLAILVGALTCLWSWRLGGAIAAVASAALFCFDPNFLAHGPLVKNDVAIGLVFVAMAFATWLVGRRATIGRVIALGLLCGAALCVKFNGMVLGPAIAAALLVRAFLPESWVVLGREQKTIARKLLATLAICAACLAISYPSIWGCYRFRFGSSPDPSVHLESKWVAQRYLDFERTLQPSASRVDPTLPLSIRAGLFLEEHHLLPEPWTNGLIRNVEGTRARDAYLLGQYSETGWWYYFPLAVLFKTPLATLVAFAATLVFLIRSARGISAEERWAMVCLVVPASVYALAAITGNLNLGIRHLLPIYSFAFIAAGVALAKWRARRPRAAAWVAALLGVGLAIETLAAFPNYIPFFNLAVGGSRGGLALLGDSNIDWGGQLKQLVAWQHAHPDRPLYLCYFGTADPNYYGLRYTNLPGSMAPAPASGGSPASGPLPPKAVWAISATQLQGTYLTPDLRTTYAALREHEPMTVLGGEIYLFDMSGP